MIWFPPGSVVGVRAGLVTHLGLVSDRPLNGEQAVISSSLRRGVVEEPLSAFSGGKEVEYRGYPGSLHPIEVLRRAREELGRGWQLFNNCEHFVNRAHGLHEQSPQLAAAVLLALTVGALCLVARNQA